MEIDIDWDEIENRLEIERYLDKERHGFGLISVLNEVPFERELNAVSRVKRDEDLKEVLSGGRSLTFEDPLAAQT
ncbi:MAG: hypothetical protein SV760_02435, partial [Halobacteria archaeon]|nr:hypothetical protein [Halobacteria archaeon]